MYLWPALALVGCGAPDSDSESDSIGPNEASIESSAVCERYLDCVTDVAPDSIATLLDGYGSEGTCWQSSSNADVCTAACTEGLAQWLELEPLSDACGGGIENAAGVEHVHKAVLDTHDTHLVVVNNGTAVYSQVVWLDDWQGTWTSGTNEVQLLELASISELEPGHAVYAAGIAPGNQQICALADDGQPRCDIVQVLLGDITVLRIP